MQQCGRAVPALGPEGAAAGQPAKRAALLWFCFRCHSASSVVRLWLHSQQSVLVLDCVALTRLFFDILRAEE